MGMTIDWTRIDGVFARARSRGARVLLETEGNELLAALGFALPQSVYVERNPAEGANPAEAGFYRGVWNPPSGGFALPGDRVVIKVISPDILHKSDVGGVRVVPNDPTAIAHAIREMDERFARDPAASVESGFPAHRSASEGGSRISGYTINEFIPYDRSLGHELLLGLRWTEDFGPVVTFGPGGIYTEFLAANFQAGRNVAIFSPEVEEETGIEQTIDRVAVMSLVTGRLRGQAAKIQASAVVPAISRFMALARRYMPHTVAECEINPLVVTTHGLVALDVLVKLADTASLKARPTDVGESADTASLKARPTDVGESTPVGQGLSLAGRPLHKLKNLLEPSSAAIIGVSEKLNPGHVILNNLIREGFDRSRISVIKPGSDTLEGCKCFPDVASLPERVDLLVLAVSAAQAPEVVAEVIERRKAESLIVIPGGLEEKKGTEALTSRMRDALAQARRSEWRGPLINGGNCLGIRSLPGHYDTMFIPEYKMPVPGGPVSPVAFISQSGAFAISRMSRLPLNPKYAITLGNQMDLTIGDYLTYLKDDQDIRVFAVYVEGFTSLDGRRFLAAAHEIVSSGRAVILYRAGRTAAGAQASASHTASIAGDYAVTRALAASAGVVVAETLQDYEDLIKLFTWLGDKAVGGWRLGAISNAGFECVAMADNIGLFELPRFDEMTTARLAGIFKAARIENVVDVHNPLDLTPMAADAAYEDAVRSILYASNIDAAIVGCVPLTPAMNTLPAGPGHREDISKDDSFVNRIIRLKQATIKPWVAVVDAGEVYDPLVAALEARQVPTFREADRALRLFNVFVAARMGRSATT